MNPQLLPVHEMFHSFQGEGVHAGRAAFFVRFYGCDQKCGFCDSAGTWHPQHKPKDIAQLSARHIANTVVTALGINSDRADAGAFVVLTGGEPCLYPLQGLVTILRDCGRRVHIETAGHRPIPDVDFVTMSPKFFATKPLDENWERADEIKLICTSPDQMGRDLARILTKLETRHRPQPEIWLHPEWSQARNPDLLRAIVEEVKANPELRAGIQMHKHYRADAFDPSSRPDVPLGGITANFIIPLSS